MTFDSVPCHIGWVTLHSLPPAMPGQFESLCWTLANGGFWCEHGQVAGDLNVMLGKKTTHRSFSLFPHPFFLLCVCARVLPAGLKSQHQTPTSQSLWAGERRRCQDVQHQKVSPMPLLIYSRLFMRKKKRRRSKKLRAFYENGSNGNVWHFWSAESRGQLYTWKDIHVKKVTADAGPQRKNSHTK